MKIIANSIPLSNLKTGIGRYMYNLYSAITSTGDAAPYFFNGSPATPRLSADVNTEGWIRATAFAWRLPDALVFMLRSMHWWYFEHKLKTACQRQSFDIYHETAFVPADVTHIPVVYTIHDLSLMHHPETHPRERVWFFNYFFKRRLRYASHILTVSEFIRSEIIHYLKMPASRVTAIPLAADPVFSPRPPDVVKDLLRQKGWPDAYILFAGSLEPRKNLRALVAAIRIAKTNLPVLLTGWQGWGDKPWIHELCQMGLADRFIFTGYVDDDTLACLYSGASMLVYPSLYEGFGLPILEAMACDCPVVCSNAASMPEVAGDAAWLIAPDNPADIAAAIDKLAGDAKIRQSLVQKGRRRVKDFSWQKTAAETLDVFKAVIHQHRNHA